MPLRRILRLAPWGLRERILISVRDRVLPRVAPERRLHVARRIVPLSPRPRLRTSDEPTMRVRGGEGRVTARRDATASPASVRRDNLSKVLDALDAAGIDHFRIPTKAVRRTAVAVPADDRAEVLALLRAAAAHDGGRLSIVSPQPRRFRRDRGAVTVARVWWPVTDPHGNLLLGTEYGCEVEFWAERGGTLVGPRPNPVADVVALDEPSAKAPESVFSAFSDAGDDRAYRTREVFTLTSPEHVGFGIDVVYTWVDGGDPDWQARKARAAGDNTWLTDVNEQAANDSRFVSRDELRYSLRSLHCFAPWVRRVFIVTDDQVPAWLDTTHPAVTVVSHREIFGDTGRLPTFNSQAIESRLHRIPGLSEHFLYLNDDMFFARPVTPDLFFTPGGLTRFFPSHGRVGSAPSEPSDRPVNAAGKNNRELIKQAFGRVLTRKMLHTPYPSRRSVLTEIEQRFGEHLEATAGHQFRHPGDISLLSSLQQYYAFLTGRAVTGQIAYMYADVADPHTPFRLAEVLRRRHLDVLCLNDTNSDSSLVDEQAGLLADFLPAYFPFRSPYELAEHGTRTRRLETPAPVPAQTERHTAYQPVQKTKRPRKPSVKPAAAPTDA
jgi:hypothetical protein